MKPIFGIIVVGLALIAGALYLPLKVGIWLPDVVYAARHTLATQTLSSGHSFRVVQYWNRSDFYTTELIHVFPEGREEIHILDGDDSKTWQVPLSINEGAQTTTVVLRGGRERTVKW
jgi:hypothetical protein